MRLRADYRASQFVGILDGKSNLLRNLEYSPDRSPLVNNRYALADKDLIFRDIEANHAYQPQSLLQLCVNACFAQQMSATKGIKEFG